MTMAVDGKVCGQSFIGSIMHPEPSLANASGSIQACRSTQSNDPITPSLQG